MNNDIKDFIIESELLSLEQVKNIEDNAFKENLSFFEAVLKSGFLDQEILSKISAHLIGIPEISLENKPIAIEILEIIPEPVAYENNILAFEKNDNVVSIAFCDMKSLDILENIFETRSDDFKLFLTSKKDIEIQKQKYRSLIKENRILQNKIQADNIQKLDDFSIVDKENLPSHFVDEFLDDKHTINFIDTLFENAIASKTSFIYFNTGKKDLKISFRVFGKKYPILEIDSQTSFSIFTKLKFMADLDINCEESVLEGSFMKEIMKRKYNVNLSFSKGNFGESLTIELQNPIEDFKTDVLNISKRQNDLFKYISEKKDDIVVISGNDKNQNIKILYSFLEKEARKEQEVYSLESDTIQQIQFVNQISIPNANKISGLVSKIIKNSPEVIATDSYTKTSLLMLFNYASFGKKIYLNIGTKLTDLINTIFDLKLDKGLLVKNFSYFVHNQPFIELTEEKKEIYYLKKKDISLINKFLTKEDIKSLFINESLEKESEKNLGNVAFYTNITTPTMLNFRRKNNTPNLNIKGVFNLGLILEQEFIKKSKKVEIKTTIEREIKKRVLENAIISSFRGKIDIREVLRYLTR